MAYSKTPFFSAEFLKKNSIIDVNCDEKIIVRGIIEAQEIYVRPLLGTSLYNKLVTDAAANTVAGNYLILMNTYVIDVLIHYSLYLLAPTMVFKWRNRGIDTQSGENATPISSKEDISYLQAMCSNKAEAYAKLLNDYLITQGSSVFAELNQNSTYDKKPPSYTAYKTPMYLGSEEGDEDAKARFYS